MSFSSFIDCTLPLATSGAGPSSAVFLGCAEAECSALSGLALTGFVAGHPRLGAMAIVTSPLWVLDPELCWARTLSRFYRLGVPEGGAIPVEDAS
jgi:hypothetical protein